MLTDILDKPQGTTCIKPANEERRKERQRNASILTKINVKPSFLCHRNK